MRKFFGFAIALMLLLSLSSLAMAKSQHKNLLLNRIVVIDELPLVSSVSVDNDRALDFNNGKVIIYIPELGARASKKLSVDDGSRDTKQVLLNLPTNVPPGDYWVRVIVTNEDVTRIRHRLITIK